MRDARFLMMLACVALSAGCVTAVADVPSGGPAPPQQATTEAPVREWTIDIPAHGAVLVVVTAVRAGNVNAESDFDEPPAGASDAESGDGHLLWFDAPQGGWGGGGGVGGSSEVFSAGTLAGGVRCCQDVQKAALNAIPPQLHVGGGSSHHGRFEHSFALGERMFFFAIAMNPGAATLNFTQSSGEGGLGAPEVTRAGSTALVTLPRCDDAGEFCVGTPMGRMLVDHENADSVWEAPTGATAAFVMAAHTGDEGTWTLHADAREASGSLDHAFAFALAEHTFGTSLHMTSRASSYVPYYVMTAHFAALPVPPSLLTVP